MADAPALGKASWAACRCGQRTSLPHCPGPREDSRLIPLSFRLNKVLDPSRVILLHLLIHSGHLRARGYLRCAECWPQIPPTRPTDQTTGVYGVSG